MQNYVNDKLMPSILSIVIILMESNVFKNKEEFASIIWNNHFKNIEKSKEIPA